MSNFEILGGVDPRKIKMGSRQESRRQEASGRVRRETRKQPATLCAAIPVVP